MDADKINTKKYCLAGARTLRALFVAASLIVALLASMQLEAQTFDAGEVSMLPAYCLYTQSYSSRVPGGNNPDEISRWRSIIGPTFLHMHHYCIGLAKTNQAIFARTRQLRLRYLNSSIGEFDYVIQRAPPNFVLLPEILTKKGENLIRLGRAPQAMQPLQRAIELKPDYWPPYVALSDHYKKSGDLAKAREWLEKGLSASPDAKELQQRLTELRGGKGKSVSVLKPVAEPIVPETSKPQPSQKPAMPEPPEQPAEPQPGQQQAAPDPSGKGAAQQPSTAR